MSEARLPWVLSSIHSSFFLLFLKLTAIVMAGTAMNPNDTQLPVVTKAANVSTENTKLRAKVNHYSLVTLFIDASTILSRRFDSSIVRASFHETMAR